MSQTETRPGFRLPWTADRPDADQPTDGTAEADTDVSATTDQGTPDTTDLSPAEELVTTEMTDTAASTSARRPTKFMADLSRAMQTAAEASRDETMTRFAADAKVAVDDIRAGSAEEAAALRRQADDDVAAVREWSKSEIARIREETDTRIAARKQALDGEMDAFAAIIEARVERVNAAVGEFEAEMAEFFERLASEQDPTRIATMAQAMPDPPDLSALAAAVTEATPRPESVTDTATEGDATPSDPPAGEAVEGTVEASTEDGTVAYGEASSEAATGEAATEDAQVQAEGEVVAFTEGTDHDQATETEGTAETTGSAEGTESVEATEPAEAQLEASEPDFAAAEAEAAAMSGDLDADSVAMLAAARLDSADAGSLSQGTTGAASGERVSTRVVVLGLVSVASIATFKRSLGRVSGVSAIGVASGPDGEFVFTVSHDAGLTLANAITALPGFEARITAETPDGLEVAAHDPDAAD